MGGFGVIVECSLPEQNNTERLSCSGIYMEKGIVLTHGTIVSDVLRDERAQLLLQELESKGYVQTRKKADLLNTILHDTQSSFRVILPPEQIQGEINSVYCNSSASVDSVQNNIGYLHSLMHSEGQDDELKKKDSSSLLNAEGLKNMCSKISEITVPSTTSEVASSNYWSLPAMVERLFIQPGIGESISSIMPSSQGWKLMEDKKKNESADLESLILSTFVLLKILPDNSGDIDMIMEATSISEDVINVTEKMIRHTNFSYKGTNVYVESSPFGSLSPGVFLNSLSHGIISNVSNSAGDILLTDARCIIGSEGAPVFAVIGGKKYLCGMVILPFCWRDGEWLGLTLLASAKPILQVLLHSLNHEVDSENRETKQSHNQDKLVEIKSSTSKLDIELKGEKEHEANVPVSHQKICKHRECTLKERYLNQGIDKYLNDSVVAVCSGGGWGSGIVISTSPGIILTCAHVIHPATSEGVKIVLSDGESLPGQVIHQTQPRTLNHQRSKSGTGSGVWDLAVIITARPLPFALPLASSLPPEGSPVIVAGYGMFSHRCLPTPTLSRGVVSKVVNLPVYSLQWPACSRAMERCMDGHLLVSSNNSGMVPMIMQTTCAVYAGTSGGPVVSFHPQYGLQVIGVVACNTRDTTSKANFPHINMAIPTPAIFKILKTFVSSGDKMVLRYLDAECSAASQLWSLGLIPQSRL